MRGGGVSRSRDRAQAWATNQPKYLVFLPRAKPSSLIENLYSPCLLTHIIPFQQAASCLLQGEHFLLGNGAPCLLFVSSSPPRLSISPTLTAASSTPSRITGGVGKGYPPPTPNIPQLRRPVHRTSLQRATLRGKQRPQTGSFDGWRGTYLISCHGPHKEILAGAASVGRKTANSKDQHSKQGEGSDHPLRQQPPATTSTARKLYKHDDSLVTWQHSRGF